MSYSVPAIHLSRRSKPSAHLSQGPPSSQLMSSSHGDLWVSVCVLSRGGCGGDGGDGGGDGGDDGGDGGGGGGGGVGGDIVWC